MSSQKLIAAILFITIFDAFISFMAAEGSIIGDDMNCRTIKSKFKPFEGQNAEWRNPFQKAFTEQEIETTECANDGEECFGGIFSYGSGVKGICKTQTIDMTIDMYRIDKGKRVQVVKNVPVGCGCHFIQSTPN